MAGLRSASGEAPSLMAEKPSLPATLPRTFAPSPRSCFPSRTTQKLVSIAIRPHGARRPILQHSSQRSGLGYNIVVVLLASDYERCKSRRA